VIVSAAMVCSIIEGLLSRRLRVPPRWGVVMGQLRGLRCRSALL